MMSVNAGYPSWFDQQPWVSFSGAGAAAGSRRRRPGLSAASIRPGKLGTSGRSTCCARPILEDDMNKKLLLLLTAASLLTGPSFAQNPPATDRPNNNAVNSSGQNNSDKPVSGANSFTEGQAKSKIEQAGYTDVTGLKKDDNGVWRGKASKGGTSTNVSLDFQGNVNAAK
ncbi:hypothetical protein DXU07_16210 [Bradyrhizobium elkanii]|nr:hypothetical protein [Bradyrhizobium elkanii]